MISHLRRRLDVLVFSITNIRNSIDFCIFVTLATLSMYRTQCVQLAKLAGSRQDVCVSPDRRPNQASGARVE